jgi:Rod binding domain-containing protein
LQIQFVHPDIAFPVLGQVKLSSNRNFGLARTLLCQLLQFHFVLPIEVAGFVRAVFANATHAQTAKTPFLVGFGGELMVRVLDAPVKKLSRRAA